VPAVCSCFQLSSASPCKCTGFKQITQMRKQHEVSVCMVFLFLFFFFYFSGFNLQQTWFCCAEQVEAMQWHDQGCSLAPPLPSFVEGLAAPGQELGLELCSCVLLCVPCSSDRGKYFCGYLLGGVLCVSWVTSSCVCSCLCVPFWVKGCPSEFVGWP